jgi:membrane-associated protease RseP (regulator of RpoE activity)
LKEIFESAGPIDPDVIELVKKGFLIKEEGQKDTEFIVEPRFSHKESFDMILKDLSEKELYPLYRRENGKLFIRIAKKKGKRRGISPFFHSVLLFATVLTVTIAGFIWWAGGDLFKSVLFTVGLMGILGGHELGHALVARKNRVDATLPFFLPVPPFFAFGTLGAVIFMNSPIPDRKSLFDIGIAGPLTGFALSVPVLIIGISLSHYVHFDPENSGPFLLGSPLLVVLLIYLIQGLPDPSTILTLHPIAVAGWAGVFVTALNLLPMGQLDGGHVIRAVFPKKFKGIYKWIYRILFVIGSLGLIAQIYGIGWLARITWPGWLIWAILVYFMTRLEHPGPLNDVSPLDTKRKITSILILIVFLISFTPAPIVSI